MSRRGQKERGVPKAIVESETRVYGYFLDARSGYRIAGKLDNTHLCCPNVVQPGWNLTHLDII